MGPIFVAFYSLFEAECGERGGVVGMGVSREKFVSRVPVVRLVGGATPVGARGIERCSGGFKSSSRSDAESFSAGGGDCVRSSVAAGPFLCVGMGSEAPGSCACVSGDAIHEPVAMRNECTHQRFVKWPPIVLERSTQADLRFVPIVPMRPV